jgi:pimeloyl-ACP methyl ester carboxylesterase
MGAGIALQLAIRHPALARKLVLAALATGREGFPSGILEGIGDLKPEHLAGTPWEADYAQIAPNPAHWPTLIEKTRRMDMEFVGWPSEEIEAIQSPALILIGDSDVVRPEHAVQTFRLFGGGVAGDVLGLPASQLAILPGTTHVTLVARADWLVSMIEPFLDAPLPESR